MPGLRCGFSAVNHTHRSLDLAVSEASRDQADLFASDEEAGLGSRLALEVGGSPKPVVGSIRLTRNGGLSSDALDLPTLRARQRQTDYSPTNFITTESLSGDEPVGMWNKIALTPAESFVLKALQFLDPDIERIAAQASSGAYYRSQTRGGFIIKRKGADQPVPIGSMGDGMWRMLAMAIAITQSRGGVLLVDEIDTGLHYSVMSRMWDLVYNAASETFKCSPQPTATTASTVSPRFAPPMTGAAPLLLNGSNKENSMPCRTTKQKYR